MAQIDRKQTKRYYDTEANQYDSVRYASLRGRRLDAFHKSILERFIGSNVQGGENVIELGCGTGRLLEHFVQYDVSLTGIDNSDGMLKVCRERLADVKRAPELFTYSIDDLEFDDSSFDFAYSILVINLLPNYPDVFKEVARILKPGGRFVFNVPNLESIFFPGGLYVNSKGHTVGSNEAGYRYSHWFTRRECEHHLSNAGFGSFKVIGQPLISPFGTQTPKPYNTLFGQFLSKSIYFSATLLAQ